LASTTDRILPRRGRLAIAAIAAALSVSISAGPGAIAAPTEPSGSFQSWAPLGDYERTALEQASTFRMILPTRQGNLEVAFHPVDVVADSYQAEIIDRRGARTPMDRPAVLTFTGTLASEPGQRDFAKLAQLPDGSLAGLLRVAGVLYDLALDPADEIPLLWIREISAGQLDRVLDGCGLATPGDPIADAAPASSASLAADPAGLRVIELATEADARFVARSGDADRANARILSIVNAVNGFYESDLGLTNRVVVQRAWSRRDPYRSKNPEKLLSEFRGRFASDVSTPYHDAELFTGRNLKGRTLGWGSRASECRGERYGVNQAHGLSDSAIALQLAHQQAHNLGADHAEAGLMASVYGAVAARFDDASRSEIEAHASAEGCFSSLSGQPPTLDPVGPQQVAEGGLLELQLTARDADGEPVVFDAAPLPPGASISSDGRFAYAPPLDTAGCGGSEEISIAFVASDEGGSQASEIVPIRISDLPMGATPVLEESDDLVVDAGQVVWLPLVASDADGDSLTFTASALPAGAYFDPSGLLIWQPDNTNAGLHTVGFEVSDCTGRSAAQSVSIQVNPVPAPHLISLTPSSGVAGTLVEITGTGFAGRSLEVSFGASPATVQSAGVTRLVVQAPPRCDGDASVAVSVRRDGIASDNSLTFTYQGAASSGNACGVEVSSRLRDSGR
jgi:hypothetical protein